MSAAVQYQPRAGADDISLPLACVSWSSLHLASCDGPHPAVVTPCARTSLSQSRGVGVRGGFDIRVDLTLSINSQAIAFPALEGGGSER